MAGKRFASKTRWGGGGAGAQWGVKSRAMGGGRRKVSMAVPAATRVGWSHGGRGVLSGGRRGNPRTAGFLGIELKFLDCAFNGVVLTAPTDATGGELQPSTGCTNALSVPAQGVGEQQRDGRAFTLKSMYINGVIDWVALPDQADATEPPGVFIALVLDTQTNAAAINSEDVFDNPGTSAQTAITPLRNLENSKRFRVVDSVYLEAPQVASQTDGASTASYIPWGKCRFKLAWSGEIRCDTKGTTADVASVTDNSFHLIGYSSTTNFTPSLFALSRARFVG